MQKETTDGMLPLSAEIHFGKKYIMKKIGAAIILKRVNLLEVFIFKVSLRKMKKSIMAESENQRVRVKETSKLSKPELKFSLKSAG